MISSDTSYCLNSIGIESNSPEIQILKAIIKAGHGLSKPVTFKQIFDQVNARRRHPFSDAWIYKCLKILEQAGFLSIQSIGNPKLYMVSEESMLRALALKCRERIGALDNRKIQLENNRLILQNGDLSILAEYLEKCLTESSLSQVSTIIEGIDNIKRTIAVEICEMAQPGDTIRVIGYFHIIESGIIGPGEESIIKAAIEGVNVRGLLIPTIPANIRMMSLKKFLGKSSKLLRTALEAQTIQVRMANESVSTYRMICLNSEKMILYLSHSAECGSAAMFHINDNPELITDAIRTFDQLWANSSDTTTSIRSLFR